MTTKKTILITFGILITIVIIASAFIFSNNPKLISESLNKCGDGVCDTAELANPNLCPSDCEDAGVRIMPKTCPKLIPSSPKLKKQCEQDGGKLRPKKNERGCYGGYECETTTISYSSSDESSPFGIFGVFGLEYGQFTSDMNFDNNDYWEWAGEHFRNLGAKWSRQNTLLICGLVEPELGGGYDWQTKNYGEETIKNAYKYGGNGFNLVLVIDPGRKESLGGIADEDAFKDFVTAAVEKYGNDVKYWQAYNEPFPNGWKNNGGTKDSYINFLKLMSDAVKGADPEAKIILGAEISEGKKLSNGIKAIISGLNG